MLVDGGAIGTATWTTLGLVEAFYSCSLLLQGLVLIVGRLVLDETQAVQRRMLRGCPPSGTHPTQHLGHPNGREARRRLGTPLTPTLKPRSRV